MNDEGRPARKNYWVVAGELTAIAFEFSAMVGGGVVAGLLADRWLGTEPWLLILFALLGTGTGFYRMIQTLLHFQKNQ